MAVLRCEAGERRAQPTRALSLLPNSHRVIAQLPSNAEALRACAEFPRRAGDCLALSGPSGWGKSHLIGMVCSRLGPEHSLLVRASDLLEDSELIRTPLVLILDGGERIRFQAQAQHALRVALEERRRRGQSTLISFAGPTSIPARRLLAGAGRQWQFVAIGEPNLAERQAIVVEMGRAVGVPLHRALKGVLAAQLRGNGHSLLSALRRLKESRMDCRRVKNLLPALGVVLPFLHDDNGWDARDEVWDASCEACGGEGPEAEALYCWMLHRQMGLSERRTAAIIGRTGGQVYRMAAEMEQRLHTAEGRQLAKRGLNGVQARLLRLSGVQ